MLIDQRLGAPVAYQADDALVIEYDYLEEVDEQTPAGLVHPYRSPTMIEVRIGKSFAYSHFVCRHWCRRLMLKEHWVIGSQNVYIRPLSLNGWYAPAAEEIPITMVAPPSHAHAGAVDHHTLGFPSWVLSDVSVNGDGNLELDATKLTGTATSPASGAGVIDLGVSRVWRIGSFVGRLFEDSGFTWDSLSPTWDDLDALGTTWDDLQAKSWAELNPSWDAAQIRERDWIDNIYDPRAAVIVESRSSDALPITGDWQRHVPGVLTRARYFQLRITLMRADATDHLIEIDECETSYSAPHGDLVPRDGSRDVDFVQFNTLWADGTAEGKLQWNIQDGTLEVGMPGGTVNLQIGQEQLVRCRNESGSLIANGSVVYQTGASGNKPLLGLADASDLAKIAVIGVATEDIPNLDNGYVTVRGLVRDLNTSSYSAADILWLSPTTPGAFTATKPTAPDFSFIVGAVLNVGVAPNGTIGVRPTAIPRLDSLSDVNPAGKTDGQLVAWDNDAGVYKPVTLKVPVVLYGHTDHVERFVGGWSIHGELGVIEEGAALSSGSDIDIVAGLGKIMISVNAGSDLSGTITLTGTTVDRDTQVETADDTETITIDSVTTDDSDTDVEGNVRHAFTGAYLTSKWFKGAVNASTSDLNLSDIDIYQTAFKQLNDHPAFEIATFDMCVMPTNANAWMYAYLYALVVTGDKCDITREASLVVDAGDSEPDLRRRKRKGLIGKSMAGATDGFWCDIFFGPTTQAYWEDVNHEVTCLADILAQF